MAFRQAHCLAQNLGPFPQRQARTPQLVVSGGRKRSPHERFIVQGHLCLGGLCRPPHPSKRPGPPNQVVDEVLGPSPVRRYPRLEPRLVADDVPRQGANEVILGVGVAGPWARLLRKEGVTVAQLVPLAGCHAGSEDRQVHAV